MDECLLKDGTELANLSRDYILTEKEIESFVKNVNSLPKLTEEDARICFERLSNNRKDV